MQSDLQRYLDGELSREELAPESLRDADRYEPLLRAAATFQRLRAPGWLENRVMVSLPAQPRTALSSRIAALLLEPRHIQIRPLRMGLAGAGALALAFLVSPWGGLRPDATDPAPGAVVPISAPPQVYWQFVFSAPNARSVAVAGDFNNWQSDGVELRDLDGDGVWTGIIPLRPGTHKYMFLINGEEWVTDPQADRYLDDGFGMRNAVITVVPPLPRTL